MNSAVRDALAKESLYLANTKAFDMTLRERIYFYFLALKLKRMRL